MKILLDIDGVLVTTGAWRKVEQLPDGFMKFDEHAAENLALLLNQTNADIVLTTTHRISRSEAKWEEIFKGRGFKVTLITKVNDCTKIEQLLDRYVEIKEWVESEGSSENYVIIDDDSTLHSLPEHIKQHWVATKSLIGFDKQALEQALHILLK